MLRHDRLFLGLAAAALLAACPAGSHPPDGGAGTGHPDGGSPDIDGGSGGLSDAGADAGSRGCVYDVDCLGKGERCDGDGGCVPADPCDPAQGSNNCTNSPYCWIGGISTTNACYCHPLADGGGACYVQIPPCGPCEDALDCGPASQVDNPATCAPVGTSGSYCLPLNQTGTCPSGFVAGSAAGQSVCTPSCGSCPCSGCSSDSDCPQPADGICNASGNCQPPCETATDCPPGQVCHVLEKYLEPSLGTLYAAGRCGAPCGQDSDCARYQGDGGTPLVCEAAPGGERCRPKGCISDLECGQAAAPDASVVGWCDIWNGNQCVGDGCRIGLNPVGGQPFDDCIAGDACELPDGGAPGTLDAGPPQRGGCFQIPCFEVTGGAHDACNAGQLCCGEGDGGTSDCAGANPGACYPAPNPPWCVSCDPSNGAYLNPACAQAAGVVPGAIGCVTASGIPQNPPTFCAPSCDPAAPWTCPAGWTCEAQAPYLTDSSGCGSAMLLDAGEDDGGNHYFQCGCAPPLVACPSLPVALAETATCADCPISAADGGCTPASDGLGFNCLCDPSWDGGCPSFQNGGQTYQSTCVQLSGGAACVGLLPLECEKGVCGFGHACFPGHYACPDAG